MPNSLLLKTGGTARYAGPEAGVNATLESLVVKINADETVDLVFPDPDPTHVDADGNRVMVTVQNVPPVNSPTTEHFPCFIQIGERFFYVGPDTIDAEPFSVLPVKDNVDGTKNLAFIDVSSDVVGDHAVVIKTNIPASGNLSINQANGYFVIQG